MTTNNNLANLIKNRIREVTTTDTATNETKTTVKAVNLRASDFSDKAEWKAYSRRLLELAPIMQTAATAFDGKDDAAFTAARKTAVDAMQGIVGLLCNVAGLEKFTVQKKDVNYILRLAYGRKVDKENKAVTVTVKSKSALQTLVEDVIYYHANGLKLPAVGVTDATQTALDKLKIADAKAKTEKTAEAKTAA